MIALEWRDNLTGGEAGIRTLSRHGYKQLMGPDFWQMLRTFSALLMNSKFRSSPSNYPAIHPGRGNSEATLVFANQRISGGSSGPRASAPATDGADAVDRP